MILHGAACQAQGLHHVQDMHCECDLCPRLPWGIWRDKAGAEAIEPAPLYRSLCTGLLSLLMDTSQHVAVAITLLDSPVSAPPANRPAC